MIVFGGYSCVIDAEYDTIYCLGAPAAQKVTYVSESRFLRHPGIPDGRKIRQKSRKIRKTVMLVVTYS